MSSDNSGLIVAAIQATDADLATSMDAKNSWQAELEQQGARVTLYRQYEEGEHRSGITDQMKNMLRIIVDATGIDDFNDNYCSIIVDKMAGRLQVTEITTGEEAVDKSWLSPLLTRNDWPATQGTVFAGAVRDGESFIMIDPQTLLWSSEPTYDGFSGIVAIFDQFGKTPIWACKLWSEAGEDQVDNADLAAAIIRIVVYQPQRISYWQGKEGGKEVEPDNKMQLASAASKEQEMPSILTNEIVWSVGKIPIIHFANKYTNFNTTGRSEIRPAIPLQDVLNRTLHSMIMASEFSAFQIKWSIGMEIDANNITPGAVINLVLKDASGNIITEMSPELVEFMKAVRVGQFESTDIGQYIVQIDKLAREVSQISQTPIYGVTTEGVLSGEALKQLEIGLIGKCERFQRDNTDAIRQLIQLAALMQNSFVTELGSAPKAFTSIAPIWKSAELLDATAQITVLITMRKDAPGLWDDEFYRGKIGGLLGMSQSDIKTEGEKAKLTQASNLDLLIGAGGGAPVIQ